MDAFLLSFGVILLAELGDKSQLMALAFASRYRALTVLVAVTIATLLVHAGSVALGAAFALALPTAAIQVVAGIAFFGVAAWTLRGDELGEADQDRARRSGGMALLTIGTAFFLAELGDKTVLATITLATTEEPWGTWLGSTAGMVAADAIAIGIVAFLGTGSPRAPSSCSRRSCSLASEHCSWPRGRVSRDLRSRPAWTRTRGDTVRG